jgi:putative ABC transport system substrate-binding protein
MAGIIARRDFIAALGSAAMCPLAARAKQAGRVYRIGFLANDPTIPSQPAGEAFVHELAANGFIEGKNILIDWRFAEGRAERYADLAGALVKLQMDLIVASTTNSAIAVKQATKTIPIVMLNATDPIGSGILDNLAAPGGNVTGLTQEDSSEIAGKRLQLLKDAVPQMVRVAVLMNPDARYEQRQWKILERAAQSLHISLQAVDVRQKDDFAAAFVAMGAERPDTLFVTSGSLNFTHRALIMTMAANNRLPTMSSFKESTEAGGLMSYGNLRTDAFARAAIYVSKILKGAKPSELPVEQPVKYELVINLKTAKALNLELPRSLLLIADEVIE